MLTSAKLSNVNTQVIYSQGITITARFDCVSGTVTIGILWRCLCLLYNNESSLHTEYELIAVRSGSPLNRPKIGFIICTADGWACWVV